MSNIFKSTPWARLLSGLLVICVISTPWAEAKKKVLFIAGNPSHGNGEHEFRAGSMLLAKALNESGLDVEAKVHSYGWPQDQKIFDGVDACIIYADAGGAFGEAQYAILDQKVKQGMSIMFMHYGVHPTKHIGQKYFMPWIGGYFEDDWSVNPHWIADITTNPKYPIGNGVTPGFKTYDEYYWNIRFPDKKDCDCCHSLATSTPTPEKTIRYINLWNDIAADKMGTPQTLMWCRDPKTGGRGLGFTGGHYHHNWAVDDFRTLVLNAIVWLARGDVPKNGVPSKPITQDQLNANLDKPVPGKPILLPSPDLLKQKPMPMPPRKKEPASIPALLGHQSPPLSATDKLRLFSLNLDIKDLKEIELYVDDLGTNTYDWADWLNPTFLDAAGTKIPVDKSHIVSSQQAWGELGINTNTNGGPLKVAGEPYSHGLGTHASSSIILRVPPNAVRFTTNVALDDGGALQDGKITKASVQFTIRKPQPASEWQPNQEPRNVDLEYFVVPEGLEVTRWASSPHLFNPTNIDIDQNGRIWVAEGVNYRSHNGRRPLGDRIAVLEDTDGDGQCDSSHTFVQEKELIAPLGVAVFDNVVVVSQPPNLIVYTDVNRDLKFDPTVDKRAILLNGFNATNHDHSLHSVTAGPDGKWYINNGNCGAIFTSKDGKTFRMGGTYYNSGGGVWPVNHTAVSGKKSDDGFVWTSGFSARMNPDGTGVEIIGHGYRNSFEHCTTSLGDLFQNDNDDPPACRVSYVLEYGNAGYFTRNGKQAWNQVKRPGQEHWRAHWRQDDPGTFEAGDVYGGGSPTGIVFYENGALGEKWDGLLLSAEAGKNVIFGYQPKPNGATWQLDRSDFCTTNPQQEFSGSDFVHSKPSNRHKDWKGKELPISFRPSDVAVGPDGAIYITDWFDGRVGGHADLDDSCSGAIYRIAPKGFKPKIPQVDLKTTEGQITALSSPAINVRYLGFTALKAAGAQSLPAVTQLLSHPNPWIAARAIWLLPYLGEAGNAKCVSLLADKNELTRLTAYRALRRSGADILPYAEKLASDPSTAVRRDVALSMRGLPADKSAPILIAVAAKWDGKDKNYLESIGLGAENHESAVWTALKAAQGNPSPEKWSDDFAKLTWRLWPAAAVSDLKSRALSSSLSPEQRAFAVESIAFIDDRSAADAMLTLAEDKSPVKAEASYWLLRCGLGAWSHFNLMDELKKRDIYNPEKITTTTVTVAAPEKAKFTVEDVLKLKGDAEKGKQSLMRCTMCHHVDGTGPVYGPHLQGWGQTQSKDVIARSIIEPSADIAHGYDGYAVTLKDGKEVHGLVISDGNPVIMKSTGGLTQMIPRDRIKDIQPLKRSLMLSADQLGLKAQDVADIVEYLKSWK